jgi:myo-inositol 2-dehydrogenase / D-chiro-inositol 1-dehydrogenase
MVNRRQFIKTSALAAAGVFTIVPRHVLGGSGYVPPSDIPTRAVIGVGEMGSEHVRYTNGRLLAVCDVDREHLQRALEIAGPGVQGYTDFRDVLARRDIDLVHIATPPHWHALIAIAAAQSGKDIWCEKPMTRTIGEGKRLVDAVQRSGAMFRVNTWFRFQEDFYELGCPIAPVKKIVQNGLLGWPLKVTVGSVTGFDWKSFWQGRTDLEPEWIPENLNYDMWLGPAPYKPYNKQRVHVNFRGYWDYDGGGLGDMGQHYLDPVQFLLGKDDTSPVEIEADAPQSHPDAVGTFRRIWMRYADGCEIVLDDESHTEAVPFIEGPEGKLYKRLESTIPDLQDKLACLPDPEPQITDFNESIRQRRRFALNEQNAHRSATLVNLAKIAVQTGRKLYFDPVQQRFVNDEGANRLVDQPLRAPWFL